MCAAVSGRFLAAVPRTDPLHTLYATLNNTAPPAATVPRRGAAHRPAAHVVRDAEQHCSPGCYRKSLRRVRAAVSGRFLAAVPRTDPLHTLYATLNNTAPPAATCVCDEKWGEWRTHAAMLLANSSARPEQDARTITTLGRLKYHDPALSAEGTVVGGEEGAESGEGSPRHHQWLDDVKSLAHMMQAQQYQQTPNQTYAEPHETPDYSQYYQPTPAPQPAPPDPPANQPGPYQPADQPGPYHPADQPGPYQPSQLLDQPGLYQPSQVSEQPGLYQPSQGAEQPPPAYSEQCAGAEDAPHYQYADWTRTEETHSQSYGDPYWQGDSAYNYAEVRDVT
ncbi:Crumbs [Operophtera brumata]|uniref:Crumbs n=1 Tax=Operophtera brumata TaxID=104452 RepID=A0A0L7LDC8_OPEBR|nr:Crumbs [Operophtera brumata]